MPVQKQNSFNQVENLYQEITNKIIASLEEGSLPWVKGWECQGLATPQNPATGNNYNGMNILLLWMEQMANDYPTSRWMTFKQARELGANVIKGEKGTKILFAKPVKFKTEMENLANGGKLEEVERSYMATKTFTVFNIQQIEGLPEEISKVAEVININEDKRNNLLESFIENIGAEVRHGGDNAFFNGTDDFVRMPNFEQFKSSSNYYATTFHELTHWTGHKTRLNRVKGKTFGDEKYAFEELIAELGSAFLCAEKGVQVEMRHEAYIQSWLKALKNDPKFIVQAASKASQAVTFLNEKSPT